MVDEAEPLLINDAPAVVEAAQSLTRDHDEPAIVYQTGPGRDRSNTQREDIKVWFLRLLQSCFTNISKFLSIYSLS